jgi:hypothetical protein
VNVGVLTSARSIPPSQNGASSYPVFRVPAIRDTLGLKLISSPVLVKYTVVRRCRRGSLTHFNGRNVSACAESFSQGSVVFDPPRYKSSYLW